MLDEPIGLLGLLVAIAALIPSYVSVLSSGSYSYSFGCSEIAYDSDAFVINAAANYDLVAIRSRCDFSNVDDEVISIKSVTAVASFDRIGGHTHEFQNHYPDILPSGFRLLSVDRSYPVNAGESLLFDALYMIPIERDSLDRGADCSELRYGQVATLEAVSNCVRDLSVTCMMSYLNGMNFFGGAGGMAPFRAFAIRITLTDGTFARSPLSLAWYYSPHGFEVERQANCPNPDKTVL